MQKHRRRSLTILVFFAAFALAAAMHWARGALDSGFGWADDEAAHMVSGVMTHDYLVDPDPLHPVRYAERYYVHYPKVAIGQWPPGYHALQAGWTLVFGVSRESIVLLGACLAALVAALIFRALVADLGPLPAASAALVFLALPLVQRYSAMSMTELPLTLFCFAAVLAFGRLLDRGRARDGLLFAACAVAAIMTKANALALALVPPIVILLRRRWSLLRSRVLWTAAGLVALGGGPWTLYFLDVNRSTWDGGVSANSRFSREAVVFYAGELVALGGALVLIAALWGAWVRLRDPASSGKWVCAAAWFAGLLVFHTVIPSSIETRHLILLTPCLCMFAAAGLHDLASRIPRLAPRAAGVSALFLLLCFGTLGFEFPRKDYTGYDRAVAYIESRQDYDGIAVLVDSGAVGEGLAVSEFVLADRARPNRFVVRATKYLSHSSWTGEHYRDFYETPEQTAAALDNLPIGLVLFDHSIRPHQTMRHHATLQRMLQTDAAWTLVETFDVQRGPLHYPAGLELWEHAGSATRRPIYLDFALILGRDVPL